MTIQLNQVEYKVVAIRSTFSKEYTEVSLVSVRSGLRVKTYFNSMKKEDVDKILKSVII